MAAGKVIWDNLETWRSCREVWSKRTSGHSWAGVHNSQDLKAGWTSFCISTDKEDVLHVYTHIRRMCYMYTHTQARMHTHTHTQWNTTQPKQMKWGCLQEHAWTSEIIILSELSQTEKGQHHKLFACGIWKRKYEWPCLQSRNKSMDIENKLMITKEERGERVKLAVWYLHTWHM